jgi:hypothetical protein
VERVIIQERGGNTNVKIIFNDEGNNLYFSDYFILLGGVEEENI